MSKITTLSLFYYGTTVTTSNRYIDFDEGGPEKTAILKTGIYSLTEYVQEIKRAMLIAGTYSYNCVLNRSTQKITISANASFKLKTNTGSHAGQSAFPMMGYTTISDFISSASYEAPNICGSRYENQYPIFQYLSDEDNRVKENATISETPLGISQQVHFGEGSRIEMNIRVITNILGIKNTPFFENASGVSSAKAFLNFLITKGRVEFMPDKDTPSSFVKCYLESSSDSKDATSYSLKQMGLPDFYETGRLTFRKVLT